MRRPYKESGDRRSPLPARIGFVPVRMERPCRAIQARRPAPLMTATWAAAASDESVPARSAASLEIFRIAAACAKPAVCRFGLPLAERTANPAKVHARRLSLGLTPI